MFGYVRPLRDLLPEGEAERYRAVYCGLCRTIGQRYGRVPQMFLNYDFAFLAMVLSQEQESPCISCRRCPYVPTRKREAWEGDDGLSLAAAESVVLAYWKLRDGIADSGFGRSTLLRGAALLLKPAYRKAVKDCPAFDRIVQDCLEELRVLEQDGCARPDLPADTFARILQAAGEEEARRGGKAALPTMLYHIGRWIYLVDAWDDMEEDRAEGNYNPILLRYGADLDEAKTQMQDTMYASLGMAQGAFSWMDFGVWTPILENILTLGLPAMEEAVLSGQWRARKKQIIRRAGDE